MCVLLLRPGAVMPGLAPCHRIPTTGLQGGSECCCFHSFSGLFLLHTIGNSKKKTGTDPWINKYIFPNGMLPSPVCVAKAITGLYVMEDWHNFGADYDKTLMAWHQRFEEGYAEGAFQCSERVRRMYRYYLLSCAGAFRARDIQLWQIVLSPEGVEGGYCCQR